MDKKRKQRNDKGKKRGPMSEEHKKKISLAHMERNYRPKSPDITPPAPKIGIPVVGTGKLDEENDILTQMGKFYGV